MRQKDDLKFVATLNNIRTNTQTDEDIALIQTRIIQKDSKLPTFSFTLYLQRTNLLISTIPPSWNTLVNPFLQYLHRTQRKTGHITTISLKKKDGGLLSELKICLGAKVMLTSNISVQDELVNSATGTVTYFTPTLPPTTSPDFDSFVPKYIWVLFYQEIIGTQRRAQFTNISPDDNSTPIELQEVHVKHGPVTATRKQFPLVLAWGTRLKGKL